MVMMSSDVDKARERAKTGEAVHKSESEMKPHELFELKVRQWQEGSANCSDRDKGMVIGAIINNIMVLHKEIEKLKGGKK